MQKVNRVLKNWDFTRIINQGSKISSQHFTMFWTNSVDTYHIGVTISKKVSKLAVVRNRLKRQIVAILDNDFNKNNKIDLIIIPKASTLELNFQELKKEINKCLDKLERRKKVE